MTDWKATTMNHWGLINRLAARRFARDVIAEEAALYVIDRLQDNDWQRMRGYSGAASVAAYLSSLTLRLLEDFSRKKFGRLRPPLWIRKLGGIWQLLFRFLCQERLPMHEAVEQVRQRMPAEDQTDLENSARMIHAEVVDCGKHQIPEVAFEEEHDCAENDMPQQHKIEERERELLFTALFREVWGEDEQQEAAISESLRRVLGEGVHLDAEDRLLLKMCFQDGIAVAEAGRMLGLNKDQVHGRLRRLLARLRSDFDAVGIGKELQTLLEEGSG